MGRPRLDGSSGGETAQESLVFRVGKWEIRVDNRNYTVGYRDDPKQRYLYQMQFCASLKAALKNLSRRILTDKFINNNLPETERTLASTIEMIEEHDAWFEELTIGY